MLQIFIKRNNIKNLTLGSKGIRILDFLKLIFLPKNLGLIHLSLCHITHECLEKKTQSLQK